MTWEILKIIAMLCSVSAPAGSYSFAYQRQCQKEMIKCLGTKGMRFSKTAEDLAACVVEVK